ncbi:alpha/beta hydrolase-fold protein [Pelobium sp.]|nr:alpha/beta hydrolase-fold protein [Pelobium sp.]
MKNLTLIIKSLPQNISIKDSIYLAGDFNNWNPKSEDFKFKINEHGEAQLQLQLASSSMAFKLTKGSWENVEVDGKGNDINNRYLELNHDTTLFISVAAFKDAFIKSTKKSTKSKNVNIVDSAFYIPELQTKRRIWIYLPADYTTSYRKYPVIYMHDGQNLFDNLTSGYGEWGVDEILDSLTQKNQQEFIVVGIDHGGESRLVEYNPYESKFGKGKGDAYVDFIVKTLKPFIDSHYQTLKDKRNTIIAGSSMGGLISMYAGIKYPNVFGCVGVFSPSFWIAPQLYNFVKSEKVNGSSKFYLIAGAKESDEMIPDLEKMYRLLLDKGWNPRNLEIHINPNGKHNERFWHQEFPDFINWLSSSR